MAATTETAAQQGRVIEIESDQVYRDKLRETSANSLVVVYFTAKWCGPCKAIAPEVVRLSEKYPTVTFLKIDIDKLRETALALGVSSIPQFHFLRGSSGSKLNAPLVGAQADRLDVLIGQYRQAIEGSSSSSSSSASPLPAGQIDLVPFIDVRQVEALNQSTEHTKNHIFKRDDHYLESDCDEQLLVFIPFNQAVRLHSLSINSLDAERAPKTVKIFINNSSMDFNSAESTPAVQELELSPSDVEEGTIIPLKFVKFQNVNSITLFFVDNQTGAETTAVKFLRLIGTPLQGTNMKEFQRVAGQAGETDH